jgi:2-oxoisovalerate dehydrogenase E1 component
MAVQTLPDLPTTGQLAADYPNVITFQDQPDWRTEDRRSLSLMYLQLAVIRLFERWLLDHESLVHGPVHASIGQEAVAVGVAAALRSGDKITSTHRAHHHFLAKAMSHYAPDDYDPLADQEPPESMRMCVRRTLAEILGLASGWQGGRGGSMHLYDRESGNVGTTAIVGGGIPIASGAAFAEKFRATGNVALAYFGDGASSIGAFHEGISMARVWGLPAIFVVENNLYSVATTVRETVGFDDIVIRSAGQDMPGIIVDGMDVLAVRTAVRVSRQHAVSGRGPVFIEAKTYRYFHQSGGLAGSAYQYRTKEEEKAWGDRDPIVSFPASLVGAANFTEVDVERIHQQAASLVDDAVRACTVEEGDARVIPAPLWPAPASALDGMISDGREFAGTTYADPADATDVVELKYGAAISKAIHRSMERDPEAFVVGEDVGHLRGGPYGATRDALLDFPNRVLSAPICENGFCGLALGAAMAGMKPIVELMFPDFALVAADQLFNHIAKVRYMYGGRVPIPMVVRTRTAQGRGFGPQHSADPSGLFALFPGWRIVAPATPAEYVGLFNSAMISEDPVLIIEHHRLWMTSGPVPVGLDYVIPFGKASRVREGSDVTILAWSEPLVRSLRIADEMQQQEGVSTEILNLRSLDEASFDATAIAASIEKTGAVVIVEDATASQGIGVHLAERISREFFELLDHPVLRVTGKNVPTPVSRPLEEFVLLRDDDIRAAVRSAGRRNRR